MPPFTERNPDAKEAIVKHLKEHLHELSCKFLHSYIYTEVLPQTAKKRTEALKVELRDQRRKLEMVEGSDFEMSLDDLTDKKVNSSKVTVKQLLKESRLSVLNLDTVLSWMHQLDFKYKTRSNHFYVDNHKKPEVK